MDVDLEKFKQIKKETETKYKEIGEIFCPFLNRKVSFNVLGLDHIKFKGWNKTRLVSDQYLRLKFVIKFAPFILSNSNTLQEYSEKRSFERIQRNSRWQAEMVPVKYYGFISIINYNIRIKIVVKEVGGGHPFFWTIIPFWKQTNDPITKEIKKVFHEGDLETQ